MLQAETTLEQAILQIISPSLEHMGYEIVRIKLMDLDRRKTLQVMLDRIDGEDINVDDCQQASGQISALLDVEDPITERYDLEVSSAGIDRPLTRLKDFNDYSGLEAKIETKDKIDGRRRFKGILAGIDGDKIIMDGVSSSDNSEITSLSITIDFDNIQQAKLVMNDQLLQMAGAST